MTVRIIDIPKEHEDELYALYTEAPYEMVSQLVGLMSTLKDNNDALCEIVKCFPGLISVIDNPSDNIKSRVPDKYYLKFANNLTETEILNMIECEFIDDFVDKSFGSNRETLDNMMASGYALIWLEAGDIDLSDLDRYKSCDWYDETVRLFKLGNI